MFAMCYYNILMTITPGGMVEWGGEEADEVRLAKIIKIPNAHSSQSTNHSWHSSVLVSQNSIQTLKLSSILCPIGFGLASGCTPHRLICFFWRLMSIFNALVFYFVSNPCPVLSPLPIWSKFSIFEFLTKFF